jgi:REP element-mobilizing transposase RayT
MAAQRAFAIHAYCLMPDHLHFLAQGTQAGCDLLRFVKAFRIRSSREYARGAGRILWQKKCFDHILRSGSDLDSVACYISLTPVRKGIVDAVGKYPFAGSFTIAQPFRHQPANIWEPNWKTKGNQ